MMSNDLHGDTFEPGAETEDLGGLANGSEPTANVGITEAGVVAAADENVDASLFVVVEANDSSKSGEGEGRGGSAGDGPSGWDAQLAAAEVPTIATSGVAAAPLAIAPPDPAVAMLVSAKRWDDLLEFLRARPDQAASVGINDRTPLHLACEFSAPLYVIEAMLAVNPHAAKMRDQNGETPLHLCMLITSLTASEEEERLEVIRFLSTACPKSTTIADAEGHLPLHRAFYNRAPPSVLSIVIETYYDPSSAFAETGDYSSTPLDVLPLSAVRPLFDSLTVFIHSRIGTALHWAIRSRRAMKDEPVDLVEILQLYPGALRMPDRNGRLPLSFSLMLNEKQDVVQKLLEEYPEAAAIPDINGKYALHHACAGNFRIDARMYSDLIDAFPDGSRCADTDRSCLPLHYALGRSIDLSSLRCLIRAYPNALLTAQDGDGRTPLDVFYASASPYITTSNLLDSRNIINDNFMKRYEPKLRYMATALLCGVDTADQEVYMIASSINLLCACYELPNCPVGILRYIAIKNERLIRESSDAGRLPLHLESATVRDTGDDTKFINGLIRAFPEALQQRDPGGLYPLGLMLRNGRAWRSGVRLALLHFPQALLEEPIEDMELPFVLARLANGCNLDAIYAVLQVRPHCCRT